MPKTEKDKTLIEGIIDKSKEILKLKNVIHLLSESLFAASLCDFRPIERHAIRKNIVEYRARVSEKQRECANLLIAAYTHRYVIISDKFHLSSAEMQAGHISLTKKTKDNKHVRVILFLSDLNQPFLDSIKEGDIREYNEDLEKNYLSHCKSVYKPESTKDLYIQHLQLQLT